MSTKTESAAVRNAAQCLRDAEALHATIVSKLAASHAAAPVLPDLDELARAVEDASASHALGLAEATEVDTARRSLAEAQRAATEVSGERAASLATAGGLQRRLSTAASATAVALEGLEAAALAWLRADMAAAEAAYLQAAQNVVQALCRHAAGARALQARGVTLPNVVTLAQPLILPTVNATTAALFVERRPTAPHGIGENLVDVLGQRDEALEAELAALLEPPKRATGIVETIKRAVGAS